MSALRTGLAFPGADAARIVEAARLADEWNIDSLWIGDPAGVAGNADDTYVMVAAAAAAAATTHVRLGVFLSARSSAPPLRIAEDIGVVDQISAGRLSVAFSRPPTGEDEWLADLFRIAQAPNGWELGDGRRMPVTPAPAQPSVPLAVFDPGLAGGALVARPLRAAGVPALIAVRWFDAASAPALDDLLRLNARAVDVGANEVVLLIAATTGEAPTDLPVVFAVAGTVTAPCLRAAEHEVPMLAFDATRWLEKCGNLHHPPE